MTGPQEDGGVTVQQALPNLTIQQFKPNLSIPVEQLDQPTTPLGRVVVVLKNDPNNPARCTIQRILKDVQDDGWDAADTNLVVEQLLRWEILTEGHNGNYLRFHPQRVQITEVQPAPGVQ